MSEATKTFSPFLLMSYEVQEAHLLIKGEKTISKKRGKISYVYLYQLLCEEMCRSVFRLLLFYTVRGGNVLMFHSFLSEANSSQLSVDLPQSSVSKLFLLRLPVQDGKMSPLPAVMGARPSSPGHPISSVSPHLPDCFSAAASQCAWLLCQACLSSAPSLASLLLPCES